MNISVLVGLKNNLEYSKYFYKKFREIYPEVEICFVSYGSTDETSQWLDNIVKIDNNVQIYVSKENKTFSDTYNKAAEIATKNYIIFLHNDIIVSPKFLENVLKHLEVGWERAVGYTTIEPPIFAGHPRPGKIIEDFGEDIESFNNKKDNFIKFTQKKTIENKDKTEKGLFFFMGLPKSLFMRLGGFHNIFNPMFKEDDDFIRRMNLIGTEMFTSLDALCYHFVSKTSRFSDEFRERTKQIEFNSSKNYIRKWNSLDSINKFNVSFVVKNCDLNKLSILEPWCNVIYIDWNNDVETYIKNEQKHTTFDLLKRIKPNNNKPEGDIIIEFDAGVLTQNDFKILQGFQQLIGTIKTPGKYEYGEFIITVNSLVNHIENLIFI